MSVDQAEDFAEQGTKIVDDSVMEGRAAAQEALSSMERSLSPSIDTIRGFNLKLIAMMRASAEAAFDLARNLVTAISPNDVSETRKSFSRQQVETAMTAEPQDLAMLVSPLASQIEALKAQVATLEAKVAALQAAPLKVKASFGEVPHTGWTPSKVVVLGNDGNGSLVEIPSTIEEGGFRYTGAPSFWIAVG
jgi:hypothetical protein